MAGGRITETEVGKAGLNVLAETHSGRASIYKLKRELPKHLDLSDDDRAASLTRPGEELWEQQVRNLVSHRNTAGNVINEGFVAYEPRTLEITDSGRKRVKQ